MSNQFSRRRFVLQAATGASLVPFASLANQFDLAEESPRNIVCVGGHPDDPESGCGGVLARFASRGDSVTIIYLTRGEAGIAGKSAQESAITRTQEAREACKILRATPVFAGQIDGSTVMSNETLAQTRELIMNLRPQIVFTHWPIDSHKDHQIASLLTIQTWIRSQAGFELYFFEVCTGEQTMVFHPTDYVDITLVQEQKRKAVYCHQSQDPAGIYACGHAAMEDFRGRELGVKAAEAFVRMSGLRQGGVGWRDQVPNP